MESKIRTLDRFIPMRALIDFDNAYDQFNHSHSDAESQAETEALLKWRKNKKPELRRQLDKIAGINQRIFKISSFNEIEKVRKPIIRLWPCNPRRKPVIRPEKMLDLPDFNHGFFLNSIDWGTNDCLATSVANKVLIGSGMGTLQVHKETMLEYLEDRATAVNWSPDAKNLALGSESGVFLVWSNVKKKSILESRCCAGRGCTITVIQWHPDSRTFARGCIKGKLSVSTIDGTFRIVIRKAHEGWISSLKYSPKGDYLCSSGEDAFVRIWKGTDYSPFMEIEIGNPSRAIAWHPWEVGLLAVGEGPPGPGCLSLWHVNTAKLLFLEKLQPSASITALDFNKITGELVLAQAIGEDWLGEQISSEIIILGGPQHVVDFITGIAGTVMALMWNADHTKLGAATSDETFKIWSFHHLPNFKRRYSQFSEDLCFVAQKKFKCEIR